MASGREMCTRGSSWPGKKPGKDHKEKAVACDAAENSVTTVKGRTISGKLMSFGRPSSKASSGILMPRLGEGSEWCLSRRGLTPASSAS